MQVFQSLTKGIRFNKERFQEEFQLFNPTPEVPSESTSYKRKDFCEDTEPPIEPSELSLLKTVQEVRAYRKLNDIKVTGSDIPIPATSFFELFHQHCFPRSLPTRLHQAGYHVPTPIQLQTIPILLHHRDILACAPTGSGKTLAYLLPLLHLPPSDGFHTLILVPTLPLAQQIHREIQKLGSTSLKCCVFQNEAQCNAHTHCDVLISTPHRLSLALQIGQINLDFLQIVILDECDQLLEKPGTETIQSILKACPEKKVLGMFSATLPGDMESFAKSILKPNFIRVIVGHKNTVTTHIHQSLTFVGDEQGKRSTLRQQLHSGTLQPPLLIFVQTTRRANALYEDLCIDFPVLHIHSERTQYQQSQTIRSFRQGHEWILIATDLMARGMDFLVHTVINFDFPLSTASYIHRIGRTGRAGRKGRAVTYFTREDAKYLRCVVNIMKESGCEVPDWFFSLHPPTQQQKHLLKVAPPKRRKFISRPPSMTEDEEEGNEIVE